MVRFFKSLVGLGDEGGRSLDTLLTAGYLLCQLTEPHHLNPRVDQTGHRSDKSNNNSATFLNLPEGKCSRTAGHSTTAVINGLPHF